MAERLRPDEPAPAFRLPDQSGNDVSLSDFAGRQGARLFLPEGRHTRVARRRPAGCGTWPAEVGTTAILGISPDPPKRLAAFDHKYGLGFTLLSDSDHAVAESYGVWVPRSMYGRSYMGIERSAFLVDEHGPWPRSGTRWHRPRRPPTCCGRLAL